MAFLVVLQRLTPAERAVLLLHDVFDFGHQEIADLVGNNAPACTARWLAAAAKDRGLMRLGLPQRYGTQYNIADDGAWILWDVDPSTTDEERAAWNVPTLAENRARGERMRRR